MTTLHSAGLLPYRFRDKQLQVMLLHPGGPFWVNKDEGAWSIPKGILMENESTFAAAKREFKEETGLDATGKVIGLGECKQHKGKVIHAWAVHQDIDVKKIQSNDFTLEWPRGSGVVKKFPEIDQGAWFNLAEAYKKLSQGQRECLDKLALQLGYLMPR